VVSSSIVGVFTVFEFDSLGAITATNTVPLPGGCEVSLHAWPFDHGDRNYVAGTCFTTDSYFVVHYPDE
jgi:hypothetical protein